jgi:V/A-type H+-transporting ATPase subunit K
MSRIRQVVTGIVFFAATVLPAIAYASEEASATVGAGGAGASDPIAIAGRAIGAGLAIGLPALGTGLAQGRIGAAGAGTIAERPEAFTQVIILQVLTELILLFGFVIAFMVIGLE